MKSKQEQVSLKEILEFLKENYNENFWKDGLEQLIKIFSIPKKYEYYLHSEIKFYRNLFEYIAVFRLFDMYTVEREYCFHKKNDGKLYFAISNDVNNKTRLMVHKNVNPQKMYNFYYNLPNITLPAIYSNKKKKIRTQITINRFGIELCDFGLKYIIRDNQLYQDEFNINQGKPLDIDMIDIGINDSQLLEHISVDYVNLPNYMRNNWSTYCKKNILKELLKKSSNFTKTNDNIDKTNQNTLLDTQDLYVCLYLYDNKVGLFKKENFSTYFYDYDVYRGIDSDNIAVYRNDFHNPARPGWKGNGYQLPEECNVKQITCKIDKKLSIESIRLQMYLEGKINNYQVGIISPNEIPEIFNYFCEKYTSKEKEKIILKKSSKLYSNY